jgi:hypothetical protein
MPKYFQNISSLRLTPGFRKEFSVKEYKHMQVSSVVGLEAYP